MAVVGRGCMGLLGVAFTMIMVISLLSTSYENDFWNVWGVIGGARNVDDRTQSQDLGGKAETAQKGSGFAHAMPVGQTSQEREDETMKESDESSSAAGKAAEIEDTRKSEEGSEATEAKALTGQGFLEMEDRNGDLSQEEAYDKTRKENSRQGALSQGDASKEETGPTPNEQEQKKDSSGLQIEETGGKENESSSSPDSSNELSAIYSNESKRRTRAKTFLVVFMGHSGSTAYTTELRSHTDFKVELLEPLEHGEYERNTDLALKRARELMDQGIAEGKIPGFKIRPFHIQNKREAWRDFVKEYDTRVIWQYRENVIKQAIGEYRHKFLNDTSVIEGLHRHEKPCEKGSGQKCSFKISNMRGLHNIMNDFTKSDELLADAARSLRRDGEMMIVRYEDYLYRRERTMRETFDFLGVDYQNTAPQRQKASPDNLCEMVTNFQEVCNHFLPCQLWRPYLHDDVNNCRCKPGSWKTFDATYCKRVAWYQGNA